MYFKVVYTDRSKEILNLREDTKVGKTYKRVDNDKVFKVLNKVNFRLTLDDVDNLRVMLEGFDSGIYNDMFKRVMKTLDKGIPSIRFSDYEKEHLELLLDSEGLPEFRQTLLKILRGKHERIFGQFRNGIKTTRNKWYKFKYR